ncbi:MAG: PAS domain-containing protein, partial [Dethiobacteria bacterium]
MGKENVVNRNQFTEALFDNSLDAIVQMDSEYRVVDINQAFVDLFGYQLKDIKGKLLDDVMDMGKKGSADRCITSRVLSGEQTEEEGVRYNKNGDLIEVLIRGVPVNINGKMVGAYGIYANISGRKKSERELEAQRWRLESIIEGSNVGTWEWDLQTGEAVYDETWARIVGYTLDELLQMKDKVFETLAHSDDLIKSNSLIERHIAGELPHYVCECRMKHKKGHWVWVHDRGKVVTYSADGKPLKMFGTHSDITERKNNEEHIRFISLHD